MAAAKARPEPRRREESILGLRASAPVAIRGDSWGCRISRAGQRAGCVVRFPAGMIVLPASRAGRGGAIPQVLRPCSTGEFLCRLVFEDKGNLQLDAVLRDRA